MCGRRALFVACAALVPVVAAGAPRVSAQSLPVDFSQAAWPMVVVHDAATVDLLVSELDMKPAERPERIQVIDVGRDGFGPDDLLVTLPSSEVFLVPASAPGPVLALMRAWEPAVEYRIDSGNMPVSTLAALLAREAEPERAENAILYDLVQAVERSYKDLPVAVLFQRDSVGFTFQLWDYDPRAMVATPRPEIVSDSAVGEVVRMLEGVGYVPGRDAVGVGQSLESVGRPVASIDHALAGVSRVADPEVRNLAVRTLLLGSFDFDRSGAIDTAREIDGPTCAVWDTIEGAFPGFTEDFGFSDPGAPYLGGLVLSIAANVRTPAYRRIAACRAGLAMPATDPSEVPVAARAFALPETVARFADAEVAAEIVKRAGLGLQNAIEWGSEVRSVLVSRFDEDRSNRLEHPSEITAIPCVVWQAVASTHPDRSPPERMAATLPADLALGADVHALASNRVSSCLSSSGETGTLRVPRARPDDTPVPPGSIRALVTVPLEGIARLPDQSARLLPAKTVLLAMFDTDRSGAIDRGEEVDLIPCDVWAAFDVAFPGFARRFGFVGAGEAYRGDLLFSISALLRPGVERRILACERGETPPTIGSAADGTANPTLAVPGEVKSFLDLETSARLARAALDFRPGSAGWASTVRRTLLARYDLDRSGSLETRIELGEITCNVWLTLEATYAELGVTLSQPDPERYLGATLGIPHEQAPYARDLLQACQGR